MPIYEYRCTSCGALSEVLQKITDKPLKKCAKCAGTLEKLISRTSFQLKGGGWYATDYARKSQAKGGEKGDAAPASDAPSKQPASEAKAAKKAGSSSGGSD